MSSARRSSAVIAVFVALLVLAAVLELREPQIDTELAFSAPTTQEVHRGFGQKRPLRSGIPVEYA